jgi:hypothetical protein
MTEADWLAADDPTRMLAFIQKRGSRPRVQLAAATVARRRVRLSLVAAARMAWDELPEGHLREAVLTAEEYADGRATATQIDECRGQFYGYALDNATPEQREWLRRPLFALLRAATYSDRMLDGLGGNSTWKGFASYHSLLPPVIRDIFGNPFRPVAVDPCWLTSTVVTLADTIYADRAFDRLPILADALQDAGCEDGQVLGHCRGPGSHVRGCWVVDLVTGRG